MLDRGFDGLALAADRAAEWHGAPLRLTRFRGDGWQMLLHRPDLCLRTALYVLSVLRSGAQGLRSRVALGLGEVTRLPDGDLSAADGSAFHRAGQALDAMGRNRFLVLSPEGAPPLAPALAVLCDALHHGWTREQAEALALALPPDSPTQTVMAESLAIRQQSLADRLGAARFWALSEALDSFEAVLAPRRRGK